MDTIGRTDTEVVRVEAVTKDYGTVKALRGVDLDLPGGGFTAVMGPSGSGKSTLLHCAAGLDRPSSGSVWLGATDLATLSETALTELRRTRIGFIFQAYNLIGSLTVEQNITLPLRLAGARADPDWLAEIVTQVGLDQRLTHRPARLSGGQQQQVAIARALITRPAVVFADEPTGALDTRTGQQVLELLRRMVDTFGQRVLMVTHDPVAASWADRVVFLADGKLAGELRRPDPEQVAARLTTLGEW
ncbi:ABC transporter ATP-binding protein [Stackebrandtia nassauensis]|uniref:ABC transporter related protein n=1 Tax=Stackebrandtia nassauensis (strain DSM 44728 / CIP 108903 / NRRL B-16338 / NBRC 102104 / LLR-40K-21) TaxID=446470 RepID=D3Q749_STANL|nr:ABC transporter ATP-binding protein [Stackebrandtia nassauensis]ADD42320.1 ABC transporter related protein [Stackebrandtia nassauensis DSM 44728]